jgi:hypothetical protein
MFIIAPIIRMIESDRSLGIKVDSTISLGKNPRSGGSPLIDKMIRGIMKKGRFIIAGDFCN